MSDAVAVGFDVFEEFVFAEPFDDGFACFVSVEAEDEVGAADVGPAVLVADGSVGGHDVDDGQVVASADVVVVGVVGRRDLEEAGGELGFDVVAFWVGEGDVVVGDDGDWAVDDGESDGFADEGGGSGSRGFMATAVSPSMVSGRVVATVTWSTSRPSIMTESMRGYWRYQKWPSISCISTSSSASAVWVAGSQLTSRFPR